MGDAPAHRRWKWSDRSLHYDSTLDYYRRNISAWILAAVMLVLSLFCGYLLGIADGVNWWLAYWVGLSAGNGYLFSMPAKTYRTVIKGHMARDREFLANLEKDGVPLVVAQEILAATEDDSLHANQAILKAFTIRAEWETRKHSG